MYAPNLSLDEIKEVLTSPYSGLYKPASIEVESGVPLSHWSVREVLDESEPSGVTHHFTGMNNNSYDGRVSSKIIAFDTKTKVGITKSGRAYQLVGEPGVCRDAEYVWGNWCYINKVLTEDVKNVSSQYL